MQNYSARRVRQGTGLPQLAACGASCDICTGETIEAIAAAAKLAAHAEHDGRRRLRKLVIGEGASVVDAELFERLRVLRKRLADEAGVPAYIVFSDATLRAMAELRPTSHGELLGVPGVGPAKVERYGDAFLQVLTA